MVIVQILKFCMKVCFGMDLSCFQSIFCLFLSVSKNTILVKTIHHGQVVKGQFCM